MDADLQAFAKTLPHSTLWAEKPTPVQLAALVVIQTCRSVFYGGAAGGGKSSVILMAASLHMPNPYYRGLIVRRSYPELTMSGGLIERSKMWWSSHPDMHWNEREHRWTHKNGGTLEFRHVSDSNAKWSLLGGHWSFIAIDEAGQLDGDADIGPIMTRLRQPNPDAPERRSLLCSNPIGVGALWLKEKYVDAPPTRNRRFIPARLWDNPHVNPKEYAKSLAEWSDPTLLRQLLDGDWNAAPSAVFNVRNIPAWVPPPTGDDVRYCMAWDIAYKGKQWNDFTAGVLMAERNGLFWVLDVIRFKADVPERDARMRQAADMAADIYGESNFEVVVEVVGNIGERAQTDNYWRRVFGGLTYNHVRPTGQDKVQRAAPFAHALGHGRVFVPEAPWRKAFLNELQAFNGEDKGVDDQVDAGAYAFRRLARGGIHLYSVEELADNPAPRREVDEDDEAPAVDPFGFAFE